jgi:hypothetical protein
MTQQFSMPESWDRPSSGSPYPQPPKKKRKWPWVIAGCVALLIIIGLVAPDSEQKEEPKAVVETSTIATTTAPTPTSTTMKAPTSTTVVTSVVTSIVEVPPTRDEPGTATQTPIPLVPQTSTPVYVPPAPEPDLPSASFSNCTEAKAAGVAPIYKGEPGYSTSLDRDRDGIACDK